MRAPKAAPIGPCVVALLVALAGACTTTSAPSAASSDDCLFAINLNDWRPLDNENLVLFESRRRAYHVELMRPAVGLRSDIAIGVYDRDGRICAYGGDAIIVDGAMPDRIPIRSIRRLSEGQLEELYVQFGIRPPVVTSTESVELDPVPPEE